MDSDINLARSTVDHLNRFDMRIKLFPLAAPVGTNLFFPDYTPALRCLRPADALSHQRQRAVDVPLVKGRVDLGDERLCVRHSVLRCGRSRKTRTSRPNQLSKLKPEVLAEAAAAG